MIDKINSSQRKYFYLIISLTLIVFACRHFLIPYLVKDPIKIDIKIIYDILDKLFTSTLITVGLGIFIFWLTPQNKQNAQMKILQPIEIGDTIKKARNDTEKYWFNGGSGRYTRAVTLPYLADLARRNNASIEVIIQIMNPSNEEICTNYASYRNSLRSANKRNKKTKNSVQLDLIATIVSAYMWKTEQPLLQITIGMKDSYSLFRTDLSTSSAIITKEDPIEPAILYEKGTFFYNAQTEEFRQSFKQTRKVDMTFPFVDQNKINNKEVEILINNLGFKVLDSKYVNSIVTLVKDKNNPYA